MLKLSRLFAAALLSAAVALPSVAWSCPFCSSPSMTLSEQLAQSQIAVLVQWNGGIQPNLSAGTLGTTVYKVLDVVRDETRQFDKGVSIALDRFTQGTQGNLFLLLGADIDGKIEWQSTLAVSETSFQYILQAPPKDLPAPLRLGYFAKFLEYSDSLVATDAYGEFANADYKDIAKVADKLDREKVRQWLSDPTVAPTRTGLHGLLLGLCGNADDVEYLKSVILQEPDEFRLGIDGIMAGYLLLTGSEGLPLLNETKLLNTKTQFSETFSAMQALRFMWTYGQDRIPKDDLRASMRLLLHRPNLADLVIIDLARWEDWSVMPDLMSMYGNPDYQVPSIKKAIVRFLMIANKGTEETPEAELPAHVLAARKNLALLRDSDPQTVEAAERYFFD